MKRLISPPPTEKNLKRKIKQLEKYKLEYDELCSQLANVEQIVKKETELHLETRRTCEALQSQNATLQALLSEMKKRQRKLNLEHEKKTKTLNEEVKRTVALLKQREEYIEDRNAKEKAKHQAILAEKLDSAERESSAKQKELERKNNMLSELVEELRHKLRHAADLNERLEEQAKATVLELSRKSAEVCTSSSEVKLLKNELETLKKTFESAEKDKQRQKELESLAEIRHLLEAGGMGAWAGRAAGPGPAALAPGAAAAAAPGAAAAAAPGAAAAAGAGAAWWLTAVADREVEEEREASAALGRRYARAREELAAARAERARAAHDLEACRAARDRAEQSSRQHETALKELQQTMAGISMKKDTEGSSPAGLENFYEQKLSLQQETMTFAHQKEMEAMQAQHVQEIESLKQQISALDEQNRQLQVEKENEDHALGNQLSLLEEKMEKEKSAKAQLLRRARTEAQGARAALAGCRAELGAAREGQAQVKAELATAREREQQAQEEIAEQRAICRKLHEDLEAANRSLLKAEACSVQWEEKAAVLQEEIDKLANDQNAKIKSLNRKLKLADSSKQKTEQLKVVLFEQQDTIAGMEKASKQKVSKLQGQIQELQSTIEAQEEDLQRLQIQNEQFFSSLQQAQQEVNELKVRQKLQRKLHKYKDDRASLLLVQEMLLGKNKNMLLNQKLRGKTASSSPNKEKNVEGG